MDWFDFIKDDFIQAYIKENEDNSIQEVALKLSKNDLPTDFILRQIAGKQTARLKFPELYKNDKIIYPIEVSLQQSSSEKTAKHKASLIEGDTLADLTAGFGIDSMAFAKRVNKVIYIEPNSELLEIAKHNFREMKIENCTFIHSKADEYLQTISQKIDWIYLDPSRRGGNSKRVYQLDDCSPSVPSMQKELKRCSNSFMFKAAPFLDISVVLNDVDGIKEIHIVAIENECKEVLYLSKPGDQDEIDIKTIHINKEDRQEMNFTYKSESELPAVETSDPKEYLYEPNAAILKAGGFKTIAKKYGLCKIHPNSHLYTSKEMKKGFPGYMYQVIQFGPISSRYWNFAKKTKYRIKTRNTRLSKNEILKKLGVKEGGDDYLIATTSKEEKPLLIEVKAINGLI